MRLPRPISATLFLAIAAVVGTVFWCSIPSAYGRGFPSSADGTADGEGQARHLLTGMFPNLEKLQGYLAAQGDAPITPTTFVANLNQGLSYPAGLAAGAAAANAQAGAAAAAPGPTYLPAPVAAPVMAPVAAPVAAPAPVVADPVALAAAQAMASGRAAGGINIASSAPMALSNPIDIHGGLLTEQFSRNNARG